MLFLMRARVAAVVTVRDALELTDGNLARHLQKLEAAEFVVTRSVLRGLRFEAQVAITPDGGEALASYASVVRRMLDIIDES